MSEQHGWSTPARAARRLGLAAMGAVALVVSQVAMGMPVGLSAPLTAQAAGPSGHPNHLDPRSGAMSVTHLPAAKASPGAGAAPGYGQPHTPGVPMKPAEVRLDPVAGAHLVGSDGVLELTVPGGAVTAADERAGGGSLGLVVRQVLPASGSNAGGSGKYTFGTWLVQVVDAAGRPAGQGLRAKLGVRLHEDGRAGALDLGHTQVVVNPTLPSWVDLSPSSAGVSVSSPASGARQASPSGPAGGGARPALGATARQPAAVDAAAGTLTASVAASGSSTAVSFDTDSPVATFGRPDPFETDLSAGALSAGLKLDLPAGPGGLTPPVQLSYNSAGVSDQHNAQGAAGWVGEGWNLTLGAISWAEHQVFSTCGVCTPMWEDSWQLSDPYGTAADLVPPDINVSTYTDDSGNAITPSPVTWHTAPETRARVISFASPAAPGGMSPTPPCFRVFLSSGIMEEFGCTADSLQFYPQPTGANAGRDYVSSWLLDLITDPSGNQVHVRYQQDVATGAGGVSYPRDVVLGTVEYDSPGCRNAQVACTGSSWAPQMQVSLMASHTVARVSGAGCGGNGILRCDDPVDLSGSGGVAAPAVQSTMVLNDALVQTRASGAAGWSTLRDYQLSYDQTGPTTIPADPVSGAPESVAGRLLLTRMQVAGADGATALPARTFGYATVTQYYEDSLGAPLPASNCGPSWNTGVTPNGHNTCVLWSQSYAGNSYYLSSASNGLGLSESFTWQLARNNFHGVNGGGSATGNPFTCNNTSIQSTYPCNMPDDGSWSRAVLSERTDQVVRLSQSGQGGSQTSVPVTSRWDYTYQLAYPLAAQECPDCVASFYWGNQNDFDLLDFYNARFMGFAQASVAQPDGSVAVHRFHSTEGFGLYDIGQPQLVCNTHNPCHNDPWWDLANAAHGHEYELDQYATDGTTLLSQVRTQWQAICTPPGVGGTPFNGNYGSWDGNLVNELDHSNPVAVCEVHPGEVDRYTYDGTGGPPVHSATAYTYDGLGRVASQTQVGNTGATSAADTSGHGNVAALHGGVTEQMLGLVSGDGNPAMSFDGSSGYVQAASLAPLRGDNTRSVELWFQTSNRAQQAIFDGGSVGATGQSFEVALTQSNGVGGSPAQNTPGIYFVGWGDDVYLPGLSLADGRPHQVVVTLTGSSLGMYVDGAAPQGYVWQGSGWSGLVGQPFGLPVVPNTGGGPVQVGRGPIQAWNMGSTSFTGTLDEVAVYDHVLPAARVQAHLGAGSGYRAAVLADTPAAYWRLDDGSGGPGPNTIVSRPAYVQNDSVTATAGSATGTYIVDQPAFSDVEDTSGNRYQCSYSGYDGQPFTTGQSSGLTLGELTTADRYTGCGSAPGFTPSGQIRTTHAYDAFGNPVASSDADANAGVAGHLGCTVGGTSYSACSTYDSTFGVLPTSLANALNQRVTTGYQSPPPASNLSQVADSSGNGNQASWFGNASFGASGLVSGDSDTAMGFDGFTTYVQLPAGVFGSYPTSGSTNSYNLSFEAWFQTTLGGVILGHVDGSASQGGHVPAVYVDTSGAVRESLFYHGSGTTNTAAGPYNDGRPHHVVATYANGTDSLYVDGVSKGSMASVSEVGYATSYSYYLGTGNTLGWPGGAAGWYAFTGTLDEVAVYGTALPSARVQAHFTAGAGYRAAVLADTPTAYYRLDEGGPPLADSSGHGNNGTWNDAGFGAAPGLVSGDGDTAMGLNGTGTSGQLPAGVFGSYPTSGSTNSYNLSFEAWFQTTSDGAILGQSGGSGWVPALYVDTTGALRESLFYHGVVSPNVAAGPYNDGHPHHVVATYANGTDSLYVDGALKASSSLSEMSYASSYSYTVGTAYTQGWTNGNGTWFPFAGTLDEVALYGSALSSSRVQAHFTAGAGYKAAVLADSPAAYYRMDHGVSSTGGYGLWPTSTTDANGQTTSVGYDALGRQTSQTLPGEGTGLSTTTTAYTVWCTGTAAQSPCAEVDRTQRLNSTTTATSRAFYDGLGHLVETRSPAPGGQDVVRFSFYDASQRLAAQSVPYLVTAYTGAPGAAAYSIPDSTQAETTYTYDGLGRALTTTDALSNQSRRSYSVVCGAPGTGDATCYEQTLSIDPRGHQGGALVDGLGRTAYEQRYTGSSSSNYAVYATARYTYDFAGDLVQIRQPDGTTTTSFGYDMAGRKTSLSDPDLGSQTYTYDQDGNLVQSVDARGAAGTIFVGYDGLDRPIWRNTTNSPSGAYDTYTYDATASGNMGIGRLTSETFSAGSLSGSYAYAFDGRGQQTSSKLTVGSASYTLGSSYDDAGNVLTQGYPDGQTVTNVYTAQGWLSSVATSQGSLTLASGLAYTGQGGAFGEITGATLGNGTYTYSATYDLLDRATDLKTTKTSGGAVMFEQQRTFDGAGNVSTASTTMPGGTDNQSFCYDEQDRLTWASSATATPPCGGSNTAGTLSAALYTQSFAYDVMGRLTSGPLGTYTYGSSAHVHAATAVGSGWTAAYDTAGNMTCRAPSGSSTCAGTQTGAQLGYNNEGELASWQNAPSNPTTTAGFLYDGHGQRVAQAVTTGGTTTNTVYVGGVEEVATSGGTTKTTAYYYAGGKRIGLSVNGVVSYLASDGLGSANVTLSSSGSATAAQLYAPYGGTRYSSATMPTSYGFTGQRADATSGLDYYGARYYDPLAGQFTSADTVVPGGGFDVWGLSRYAYVEGNPVGRTDPNGHCFCDVPGTGDSFFPQSGGRLLNGNTGDVVAGPGYSQSYHLASWTARPHQYQPYQPYATAPALGPYSAPATPSQKAASTPPTPPPPPTSWLGVLVSAPWTAGPSLPAVADLPLIGECLAIAPICGAAIGAGLALRPSDAGGAAADDPNLYAQEHPNAVYASNQKENADAKRAADEVGLNTEGKDALHREISRKGYSYPEVKDIAKDLYDNFPKYRTTP